MNTAFLVFLGGGAGAVCRHALSLLFSTSFYHAFLPNMMGCFLIGVCASLMNSFSAEWKLFLMVGFLGGFTTYSGYVMYMVSEGVLTQKVLIYFLSHNFFGTLLFILGINLTSFLSSSPSM